MTGFGPTLPSAAPAEHGSYLGISCRQVGRRTTAEDDPERPFAFTGRVHQLHTFSVR
jgi:hypothetical protein